MSNGKGDAYRPVDKRKYDRGYLRVFGEKCPVPGCFDGYIGAGDCTLIMCTNCNGLGYVEKERKESGG
jgi:hypothetical protein